MKIPSARPDRSNPAATKKQKQLDRRVTARQEKLRRQYREIHGRIVDWVNYYTVEDGSLYVSIRFTDKTDFSLCFSPRIVTDCVELCDSTTDDFGVIRQYEGQKRIP